MEEQQRKDLSLEIEQLTNMVTQTKQQVVQLDDNVRRWEYLIEVLKEKLKSIPEQLNFELEDN